MVFECVFSNIWKHKNGHLNIISYVIIFLHVYVIDIKHKTCHIILYVHNCFKYLCFRHISYILQSVECPDDLYQHHVKTNYRWKYSTNFRHNLRRPTVNMQFLYRQRCSYRCKYVFENFGKNVIKIVYSTLINKCLKINV